MKETPNSWYIPVADMKKAERQRQRNKDIDRYNGRKKSKTLCHCLDCNRVYCRADYIFKKDRDNCFHEYYEEGSMPTYGLEKKQCKGCK